MRKKKPSIVHASDAAHGERSTREPRKYSLTIFAVAVLLVPACAQIQESKDDSLIEQKVQAEEFIDIFRQASAMSSNEHILLHNVATAFVRQCCESKDAAIALLKRNGFVDMYIAKPDEHGLFSGKDQQYDDIIVARQRKPLSPRTVYRAILFIKNGKVDRVSAIVDRMPLP